MNFSLHPSAGHTVTEVFKHHAEEHPARIALSLGGESLTYSGLAVRSQAIAERLCAKGVGQGDLVGVFLDRSFDLIASFLGILETGAAYVPLDTNYPPERIAFMVADTGMKRIISSASHASRLSAGTVPVLVLDQIESEPLVSPHHEGRMNELAAPEQAAYVMYTSGSTGVPKGVVVPQRAILRLVREPDYVKITWEDVFLQLSPVSFDAATLEIWGALLNGARLILMPPGQPSLKDIGDVIQKENVTIVFLTTGLFNLIVDERLEDLKPVKQLLTGGEMVSLPHVRRAIAGLPSTQLLHVYGPTENTTFTCWYAVPRDVPASGTIPIGVAIRGTTVHVVDERLTEVPCGEEGELVTGGLGLALGYWNRPELTAERFVSDPFSGDPAARLYRTGDRVRRLPCGAIEFLGRKDDQIKLRGFRIELGEIESTIRQHKDVRDCAVMVKSDKLANKSLAAYIVPGSLPAPSAAELRRYVEARLPAHMVPSFWTYLERLPLNANGKVDRRRLPEPAPADANFIREPPRSELEGMLVELWRELLGGLPVSVTESYFELGASSLLVAKAHERLGREHGIQIPLTVLFQYPSVRSLAQHLDGQRVQAAGTATTVQSARGLAQRQALSRIRKPPMSNGGLR